MSPSISRIFEAPYAVHRLHLRVLVEEARPAGDADYLADVLLGALSAQAFSHQRHVQRMELDRLKAGYSDIVERLLGCDDELG